MEEFLKKELQTTILKKYGHSGGGCISSGEGYTTDQGNVFIKINDKPGARLMFDGEFEGLAAIRATNTVYCPKPIKVLDKPGGKGAMFVAEYVDMKGGSSFQAELGDQLARMHLHNSELKKKQTSQEGSVDKESEGIQAVDKFGFHVTTCCGFIPQDNTWQDDWVEFYARQKLQLQLDMIEKEYSDREAIRLWSELQQKLPGLFKGIVVEPSLLHGDLWGGNASETKDRPVIFDPATFYGHHEYELAIAGMFGGFSHKFYNAYHKHIPKEPGFEQRLQLYQLFHYLNHWNHFGTGYRGQSIGIMKKLTRT